MSAPFYVYVASPLSDMPSRYLANVAEMSRVSRRPPWPDRSDDGRATVSGDLSYDGHIYRPLCESGLPIAPYYCPIGEPCPVMAARMKEAT